MKGIIFDGSEARATTSLEVRPPGPGEVSVRIAAAGLCHSDCSVIDGTIDWPAPCVLGHEGAGHIDEVGPGVSGLSPGDPVVLHTLAACGRCRYCSAGRPTWCRSTFGNRAAPFTLDGVPCNNFAASSVWVEKTVVQATQAVPIPADIPMTSACLIGCGVITGVGAVLGRARVQAGETAAVFGIGGVGLNVLQGLRIAGASRVIAVDTLASKRDDALRFGATDFIVAGDDTVEAVRELTSPGDPTGGVDWAFECVGAPPVIETALQTLTWGGNLVIVGVPTATATATLPITHLTHVDRGVIGCRYGSAQPHRDIALYAEYYRAGSLLLDELVTRTYPLEDFGRAIEDLHAGQLARGVLTLD